MSEHQVNLGVVWEQVVRELSAGTLSPSQRAWMRMTRPIGLLDGTAPRVRQDMSRRGEPTTAEGWAAWYELERMRAGHA